MAQLHRSLQHDSLNLKAAVVREVDRVEATVSEYEAIRLGNGLANFTNWAGDISLENITTRMLEDYQMYRVKKAAISTIKKELYWILKMLRRNGFLIQKPENIRGRSTPNRAFSSDELTLFFQHCNSS